ncbi:VanZ family protein [Arthrobacter sp. zg-Y1110]|uniref:VanZ family protein n=1 Tax=Arthrobacter sp. zg-Y1110 TaxID=2886932 RepID=UPI001D156A18|nr:VanZ family protein [Arthrobacter sp. zg-Y1110]MCC3292059.1 VanZ family protein [Arthrobacter sp. zg-Y1110]UWX85867.1 VanZ family protein [Arthrobacter sp. zg-Y1110]
MNVIIPGTQRRRRLAGLFLLYIVALALITFWPSPVDAGPAGTLRAVLAALNSRGMPGWVNYTLLESVANVVLFVPFGVLAAACLTERFAWLGAVVGMAASCAIEAGQHVFLPARYATIHDVIANSLGAALGTLVVYAFRSRKGD